MSDNSSFPCAKGTFVHCGQLITRTREVSRLGEFTPSARAHSARSRVRLSRIHDDAEQLSRNARALDWESSAGVEHEDWLRTCDICMLWNVEPELLPGWSRTAAEGSMCGSCFGSNQRSSRSSTSRPMSPGSGASMNLSRSSVQGSQPINSEKALRTHQKSPGNPSSGGISRSDHE